ncbi:MAG: patatin-like phospholipase family protein [Bacteroidetes bacterium]|nr:patatin-like phospholipase family protein [Bacteroidota bacterium]MCH8524064.1 patatin-like phospholipase family protein [Balneolales bacterium]
MKIFCILLITFIFHPYAATALSGVTDTEYTPLGEGPRVGLVLSGGGAKGLAHISILKILEEVNMPIDFISGTSMGSIIGGLYAIGYSASEIEQIAINENWSRLFDDRVSRWLIPIEEKRWDSRYMVTLPMDNFRIGLPSGVIGGQQIGKMLSRLTAHMHGIDDFDEFPIPFTAIATRLSDGSAIVIREGHLPTALRASMSIPSIFAPVEIDGVTAIDGGVARNFPVTDVLDMGADFVIGINASTSTNEIDTTANSMLSVLNQTVFFHIAATTRDQARLVDFMVEPEIGDFGMMDFDDVELIMASADEFVSRYKDRLQEIADSLNALRNDPGIRHRFEPERIRHVNINEIHFINGAGHDQEVLLSELGLIAGNSYSIGDIELAVDRVFSLPFFDRVTYALEPLGESRFNLIVTLNESNLDVFNVGLRYDNRQKASIILSTRFRNQYRNNATLRLSLRLGEEPMGDIQYFYYLGWRPKLGVNLQANYTSRRNDLYNTGQTTQATVVTDALFTELWTGPVVSSYLIIGLGLRTEMYQPSRIVGLTDLERDWKYIHRPFAFIWYDTKDAVEFPVRGQELRLDATQSLNWFSNATVFSQYTASWKFHLPLNSRFSAGTSLFSSLSTGDYPVHYRQALGGITSLPGFLIDEIHNDWVSSAKISLQGEVFNNRYIVLSGSAGRAAPWQNLDLKSNSILTGWGVSAGLNSVVGPVVFSLSGSKRNPILYDFRIGFNF